MGLICSSQAPELPRMADNSVPNRMYMDDENILWRHGKPDYTLANKTFMKGRSKTHQPGSLERIVEDLVKTYEMEATNKLDPEDYGSVTRDFQVSVNGGEYYNIDEVIDRGTYNVLLADCPMYNASEQTFDSSHDLFRGVFTEGFPWEVLEVITGPPRVVFTWRHWANMTGPYKGREPTGELIELIGCAVADVSSDLKLVKLDLYYDANMMLAKLEDGKCPFSTKN